MSKVVAITREQIQKNYQVEKIVEAVENGYRLLSEGKIIVPPRFFTETRDGGDYMYGAATNLEKQTIMSLCSAYMPWNAEKGLPIVTGDYMYMSFENGELLAIVDGIDIVKLRTAAKSAVAAKYLASKSAKTLGLIGLGDQAKMHVEFFYATMGIERIVGYSRNPEKWDENMEYIESKTGITVETLTREEVIANSDIIVVATHSKEPLVNLSELKPGQLLIGLDHAQSVAQDIVENDGVKVYVDYHASAKTEGAPVKFSMDKGFDYAKVRGDLCELVTSKVNGRETPEDIIYFQSVGNMVEDLATIEVFIEALKDSSQSIEM